MRIPLYQVDAFTTRLFGGNPAAVCPLSEWLPEATMQAIAAENNLAETAFFVPQRDGYLLRWFTPTVEVELCGHATLASGYVVTRILAPERSSVIFDTLKAGLLEVTREGDLLAMDFPSWPPEEKPADPRVLAALGAPRPRPLPRAAALWRSTIALKTWRRCGPTSPQCAGSRAPTRSRPHPAAMASISSRGISRRTMGWTRTRSPDPPIAC
jgi:predicted PhzF superfamily epimerase YddE/YHI9